MKTAPLKTKLRSASETDQARVFINPKIIASSKETVVIYEGCGSVNGKEPIGPVVRPKSVTISAWNELGEKFTLHCNGLLARAIQHEADHLQGKEFLDRMAAGQRSKSSGFEINTINYHLKEIFTSKELFEEATIRNFRIVQTEGLCNIYPTNIGFRQLPEFVVR